MTRRALRALPDDWIVMRDDEHRHIVISPFGVVLIESVHEELSHSRVVRGAVDLSKQLRVPGGWMYVHAVMAVWGSFEEGRVDGPNVILTRGADVATVVQSILAGREAEVDTAWAASRIRHV